VAPSFADELGAHVVAPAGIDTDQFGTFTGEVTRTLAPLAAATAKARLAIQVTGVPYGLASEASYDTWFGMLAMHEEILMFVDDILGIQAVEGINTLGAPGPPRPVDVADKAVGAAKSFGFPRQGAAVKASVDDRVPVFGKGITDTGTLVEVVGAALAAADDNRAWVEPDLRAHHNPSRRDVLIALARRLARRVATPPAPNVDVPDTAKSRSATGCHAGSAPVPPPLSPPMSTGPGVHASQHRCAQRGRRTAALFPTTQSVGEVRSAGDTSIGGHKLPDHDRAAMSSPTEWLASSGWRSLPSGLSS